MSLEGMGLQGMSLQRMSLQGEVKRKSTSSLGLALDGDVPAMSHGNVLHERQAQACSPAVSPSESGTR